MGPFFVGPVAGPQPDPLYWNTITGLVVPVFCGSHFGPFIDEIDIATTCSGSDDFPRGCSLLTETFKGCEDLNFGGK